MDHIYANSAVKKIKSNNRKRAQEYTEKFKNVLRPITEQADKEERWDVVVVFCAYVRCWNDFAVFSNDSIILSSNSIWIDFKMAEYARKKLLDIDNKENND